MAALGALLAALVFFSPILLDYRPPGLVVGLLMSISSVVAGVLSLVTGRGPRVRSTR